MKFPRLTGKLVDGEGEVRDDRVGVRRGAVGTISQATALWPTLVGDHAIAQARGSGIDEQDIMRLLLETNRLDTIKYASEKGKLVLMDLRQHNTPPVQVGVN